MRTRCPDCDKPLATNEEYATIPEGEGEHLCWRRWNSDVCLNEPHDWRREALELRVRVAELGEGQRVALTAVVYLSARLSTKGKWSVSWIKEALEFGEREVEKGKVDEEKARLRLPPDLVEVRDALLKAALKATEEES
jgi:hypothetical protein